MYIYTYTYIYIYIYILQSSSNPHIVFGNGSEPANGAPMLDGDFVENEGSFVDDGFILLKTSSCVFSL